MQKKIKNKYPSRERSRGEESWKLQNEIPKNY